MHNPVLHAVVVLTAIFGWITVWTFLMVLTAKAAQKEEQ